LLRVCRHGRRIYQFDATRQVALDKKYFYAEPFPKGWVTDAAILLPAGWTLMALYLSVAAVAVGLRLSEPCDWPPLYGRLGDAYSARRFWAYSWHQMMRSRAEPPSKYLLHDVLHVKRGKYYPTTVKCFAHSAGPI
jgi:hypothetical protein